MGTHMSHGRADIPGLTAERISLRFTVGYPSVRLSVCPRVHSVLEKSLKMLAFGMKTSRPVKVLENR